MMSVLVVDGANVVGSRPDGWWGDRPGAARRLHTALTRPALAAELGYGEVVLVLEGKARSGVEAVQVGAVRTVHAERDGDSTIIALCRSLAPPIDVVTADRALAAHVQGVGARVLGPGWLWQRLDRFVEPTG